MVACLLTAFVVGATSVHAQSEFKLTASDAAADDIFGFVVSISGDYALVGAPNDDDGGSNSGAAYIYHRGGTSWNEVAKLTADDAALNDNFGSTVSISGDYALIGANENDDHGSNSGSAYVFQRVGVNWNQMVKLTADDAESEDRFGESVAIHGVYALVGAYKDDDQGSDAGAAYIFQRDGANWNQVAKLKASDGASGDRFSQYAVSIGSEYAAVGAAADDDNGTDSGSVYVFSRTDTVWTQMAKLLPSDGAASDRFGLVSISGDYILVGANGDDDLGASSGSAYIFQRVGAIWNEVTKLNASDGVAGDDFAGYVSLDGNLALMGLGSVAGGAAYVFERVGATWSQLVKLTPSDGVSGDRFGSTAIDGSRALVGSYFDDDGGTDSGSAYLMDLGTHLFADDSAVSGTDDAGNGAGVAWGDYDGDGDEDMYVVNNGTNRLYRNEGDSTFTEVGASAGVADAGSSQGTAWADYDNDGDLDLFVANNGGLNRLFRNNGNGTFTDVADSAGVDDGGDGFGVAWGDYDNDGYLDLYIIIPRGLNLLYRNNGNGTFTEVGVSAGVTGDTSDDGRGVAWGDYDNDGDLDLGLANARPVANALYRNNGNGTFTPVGTAAGMPGDGSGQGIDWGDYDNDGHIDAYVTHADGLANRLYHNNGNGTFTNVASPAGVGDTGIGLGVDWGDFDNDGDLDIYVARSGVANLLYDNNGDGTFSEIGSTAGVDDASTTRGTGVADYDSNGELDIYAANATANKLFRNITGTNNWLRVDLDGTVSNRSGIGARVRLVVGSTGQLRESQAGTGYLSQSSSMLSFGLGDSTVVDSLIVLWPSGAQQVLTSVASNQELTITEPGGSVSLDPVVVAVDTAFGAPGDTLRVPATLTNGTADPVGGLQFNVVLDDAVSAHYVGLEDTLSNPGFTVTTATSGDTTRLIVFSLSGAVIQPGSDILLATLVYALDPDSAALGSTVDLVLADVEVGDSLGVVFADSLIDGQLQVGIRGDVSLDARVSILDIIQLVRIIIGQDPTPPVGSTAYNIADMNDDGSIDVADVIAQVNSILGISPEPPTKLVSQPVTVSLGDLQNVDGQWMLPLSLSDQDIVAGMQLSISYDPSEVVLGSPSLAHESSDVGIGSYANGGELRVVAYSLGTGSLPSTDGGTLLYIPVTVVGSDGPTLSLSDVMIVNRGAQVLPALLGNATVMVSAKVDVPTSFSMSAAHPNPFNPTTSISYGVPRQSHVSLIVYNMLGQEVIRIVDEVKAAGRYTVRWDGSNGRGQDVASGIYLYRMTSSTGFSESKRMTLLK